MSSRPPRILMVSSELDPFARTGGLGDAVAGLSAALADAGADVVVVTPRYGVTRIPAGGPFPEWWPETVTVRAGSAADDARELRVLDVSGPLARPFGRLRIFLLDHPDLFARAGIYGDEHGTFGDNVLRFVVMSRGALAVASRLWPGDDGAGPDILHAHDWHAAPAVIDAKLAMAEAWPRTKAIITIHNLAFQGVFSPDELDDLALPRRAFTDGTLGHQGQVNLLHGAIALADRVTTVSPTYAREIQTPPEGRGLDAFLRERTGQLVGILNGIDTSRFDPERDGAIARPYGPATVTAGKAANRGALAREMGLSDDASPLFCAVSRLTEQKGVNLLLQVIPALVERGARVALVGTGDTTLETALGAVAARFLGRVASRVVFDPRLARLVYAGADFFVAPSRYEPCGLTQLYAMRYGAIPIVTAVGGLKDTVVPISAIAGVGTGFVAVSPNTHALLVACEDAITLYADVASHRAAILRAMARDSSWATPAKAYLRLYDGLVA